MPFLVCGIDQFLKISIINLPFLLTKPNKTINLEGHSFTDSIADYNQNRIAEDGQPEQGPGAQRDSYQDQGTEERAHLGERG
jgi:hypothetical protein